MTDSALPSSFGLRARSNVRARLRRLSFRGISFLLLGAAVNAAVAFALALLVDVSQGATQSAVAWTGEDEWTVTRWSRTGATYILSVRESSRDWSPGQATGAPNAPGGGDSVNAWASAAVDGGEEWLALEYAESVVPEAVRVYETCSTGALSKVTVFAADGTEAEAWSGLDPTPHGANVGVSDVRLHVNFPTNKVKLYFDSARVPGWNEVDAVALVGIDGRTSWARRAQASSTYAARFASTTGAADGGPAALVPAWTRFDQPQFRSPGVTTEQRAVEARGWPMLALWAEAGSKQTPLPQAVNGGTPALAVPSGRGGSMAYLTTGFLVTGGTPPSPAGSLVPLPGQAALPVRPIWGGFLANTALYAVVLFILHWALTVPRRFLREVSRLRRGCCVACGYDLGFDFVPGCPECGWRREPLATRPLPAR